jgi:DNA-directed RNA polymerase specialized sigma24 family protein
VQETYARLLARPRLLRSDDDLAYLLRALRNPFLNQKRQSGVGSGRVRFQTSSISSPTRPPASRTPRSKPARSTPRLPRFPRISAMSS